MKLLYVVVVLLNRRRVVDVFSSHETEGEARRAKEVAQTVYPHDKIFVRGCPVPGSPLRDLDYMKKVADTMADAL